MRETMFSDMHERSLSEETRNRENKEIVINDAEEARRQFRDFWKNDNSPEALRKEIEEIEFKKYQDYFWTYYSSRNQRKRSKKYKTNELFFVSGSRDKQNQLSEIAKSRDIEVLPQNSLDDDEERAIHTKLKKLIAEDVKKTQSDRKIYSPESYSLDVAWLKVAAKFEENHPESKNSPIMASDIVVLQGKDIFEKSKDEREASDAIMKLSGKEITVSCGIYLYTKTKLGTEFPLLEGVNFTIKLREFSSSEAQEYIDIMKRQGKDILNIAGVIDYSSPEAQDLIDKNVPVKIEALKLDENRKEPILISSDILPGLKDYLKGMPKELIEEMLDKQQALEKI